MHGRARTKHVPHGHVEGSRKLCMEEVREAMDPAEFHTSKVALRVELSAMTLTRLMKRAEAAAVSEEALEGIAWKPIIAEDEVDNKEAVIKLILEKEAGGSDEADLADAALRVRTPRPSLLLNR